MSCASPWGESSLIAAGLKAHQLATTPSLPSNGWFAFFDQRWVQIAIVEFEILWGILLLANAWPRILWFGSLPLFAVFCGFSTLKGIMGETSCGCFGRVEVNPWWTAILDGVIVGVLIGCHKVRNLAVTTHAKKIAFAGIVWLLASLSLLYAFGSVEKNDLTTLETEFVGADGRKTILLEPEKWVGKDFPLLPYIEPPEVREKLRTGEWSVVLYHHDCPKCQQVMTDLVSKGTPCIVCVKVPPYGNGTILPEQFVSAKLTDRLSWFVETPMVVNMTKCFEHRD